MPEQDLKKEYWRKNLQYLSVLLGIWFTVSYGFSILLVDELDKIKIHGFKLGFWFSQQGSIFVFVILIFVYVRLMNKLDKKYNVDERRNSRIE
jgi:putative solute:sodium symporter small subunit